MNNENRLDATKFKGFLANDYDVGPKKVIFADYSEDSSQRQAVSSWMPRMHAKYTIKKPSVESKFAVEILSDGGWDEVYLEAAAEAKFESSDDETFLVNKEDLSHFIGEAGSELWFIEDWQLVKVTKSALSEEFGKAAFSDIEELDDDQEIICDLVRWKELTSEKTFTLRAGWVVYIDAPRA